MERICFVNLIMQSDYLDTFYRTISEIQQQTAKQLANKESNLLQKALSKYLKRPVTLEDAKDCKKVYGNGPDYAFYYKDIHLGTVTHALFSDYPDKFIVQTTFKPAQQS